MTRPLVSTRATAPTRPLVSTRATAPTRPDAPNIHTFDVTLDVSGLSLSGDVTDYIAYIKAEQFRHLLNDDATDIEFFDDGGNLLYHECVRRERVHGHGATFTDRCGPLVASHYMYCTSLGCVTDRSVYIWRIDLRDHSYTEFELYDCDLAGWSSPDDHVPGGIYISGDGYITAFWSQHSQETVLYWRRTTNPWDISAWDAVQTINTASNATYAEVLHPSTGRDKGAFITRAGGGANWTYYYTTDGGVSWTGPVEWLDKESAASGCYYHLRERPDDAGKYDVLCISYTQPDAAAAQIHHLVCEFSSDMASVSWTTGDGTPIVGTPTPTDGDVAFANADSAVYVTDRVLHHATNGDIYALCGLMPDTLGVHTPASHYRLKWVRATNTWSNEKIVDMDHNLVASFIAWPHMSFDLIEDPEFGSVIGVLGDHPLGDYGYQVHRCTRNADGTWTKHASVAPHSHYIASGSRKLWRNRPPEAWRGSDLHQARFYRWFFLNGYASTLSSFNFGISTYPGVPDAFYVKVPTLDQTTGATLQVKIGHRRNTHAERRDQVWSDYALVVHGNTHHNWGLVNSVYRTCDDDPGPIDWGNGTEVAPLMYHDNLPANSPLHGSALQENGHTTVGSIPTIARTWVTADTVDFASATDWTIETYAKTRITSGGSATFACLFDTASAAATNAFVLCGVSHDRSVGQPYYRCVTTGGGLDSGELNSVVTDAIQPNTWHHIAWVFEGTQISAYVDGVLTGVDTAPDGTMHATTTTGPMCLGNRASFTYQSPWNGWIAEARVLIGDSSVDRVKATRQNYADYDSMVTVANA